MRFILNVFIIIIILGIFPNVNYFLGVFPIIINMRIFSQRIKELRKENGYTQRELATKLELTNSTVCDWETGRSEPDLETLKKIAQLFSVSTDYLLGLSEI